jgi:hypothetical protein
MNALLKNLLVGTLLVGSAAMTGTKANAQWVPPPHHYFPPPPLPPVFFRSTVHITNPGEWGRAVNYSVACNGSPWSNLTVSNGGRRTTVGRAVNRPAHIRISFDNGAGRLITYDLNDGWTYKFGRDASGNLDLYND